MLFPVGCVYFDEKKNTVPKNELKFSKITLVFGKIDFFTITYSAWILGDDDECDIFFLIFIKIHSKKTQ